MSFILDALRKSEHDRQRQTGPGLAEVPVAVAKPRSNLWATAAIALLIVNLIGVGILLLRKASHDAPAAQAPASAAPSATAPAVTTAPAVSPAPAPQASVTQTLPQPVLQPSAPPARTPGRNPLESEISGGHPDIDASMAASAASVPAGPPAVTRTPAYGGPGSGTVHYEPIPEAAAARAIAAEMQQSPPQTHAQTQAQAAQQALPTADEMTASAGMPRLHLDLHVYSTRPQERFIFVNSHKYGEGATLQEGPTVEQITQHGAVLNYRGNRFLLTRD
jgi:general secretion pathway protein B